MTKTRGMRRKVTKRGKRADVALQSKRFNAQIRFGQRTVSALLDVFEYSGKAKTCQKIRKDGRRYRKQDKAPKAVVQPENKAL